MKKNISDWGTAKKFVEYIRKYIYEKWGVNQALDFLEISRN